MSTLASEQFNIAVAAMVTRLETFLPAGDSTLTVLQAAERPVGVGNWQGNVERGPLAVLGLRGGRVEARVRFDLRAADAGATAGAVQTLQQQVRAAQQNPLNTWIRDFLVLELDGGDPAVPLANNDWRQSAEYRVLYEYRYEDPEDSGGLIVRIPVEVRGEHHEDDAVTRDLTRWDRTAAPPLVLRGPRTVGRLTMLAHAAGSTPPGRVVVRRTRDGTLAPVTTHGSLGAFAVAVLPPGGGVNDEAELTDVPALVAAFDLAGEDVMLARLVSPPPPPPPPPPAPAPPTTVPASFTPRALDALRGVRLETPADRLEISYEFPAGFPASSGTVVYLGTARGPFV